MPQPTDCDVTSLSHIPWIVYPFCVSVCLQKQTSHMFQSHLGSNELRSKCSHDPWPVGIQPTLWGGGISCTYHIGPGNVQMVQQSSLSSFIDVCFCLVWHQATHISTTGQQNPHLCLNRMASPICFQTTIFKPQDLHHIGHQIIRYDWEPEDTSW